MSEMFDMKLFKRIQDLKELPQLQYDSTTPMDDYHTGLFNGLEMAVAIIEDREPKYKSVELTKTPPDFGTEL
jgi:hypothetical protein